MPGALAGGGARLGSRSGPGSRTDRDLFVGEVTEPSEAARPGWVEIAVKNRFAVGDDLYLLTPAGNRRFRLEAMETLEGEPLTVAPGDGRAGSRSIAPATPAPASPPSAAGSPW